MKHSVKIPTTGTPPASSRPRAKKPWYRQLYVQVLVAIVLGITVGALWPTTGEALQPIGTTFIAVMKMLIGPIGEPVILGVKRLTEIVFKVLSFVMKAAPLGAFGAMAYAIGAFGLGTLTSLGSLILLFYVTSFLFVVVVLGSVLGAYVRLNIFSLFRYLKDEFFLILGTSTAEPALPGLMRKLTHLGADRTTVGLVVPTGYSFNLDGAAIYLSLASLYIAQATNTPLSISQQVGLLAVMLLTSKGAAGVAGGGFIALTATLSTVGTVPAIGIMLIFGIDKFMSECRALVNFYGNAVATLVIAKWDGALDVDRARGVLAQHTAPDLAATDEPELLTGSGTVAEVPDEVHASIDAGTPELNGRRVPVGAATH